MDSQLYRIVLSPDLELSPEAFVAAWNDTPANRDVAEAHLSTADGAQFDMGLVATILLSVPVNLASSALYDLIKAAIQHQRDKQSAHARPHKHVHIETREKPGGTRSVVVDIDEE